MADLLKSLIRSKYDVAHPNTSQDSFYSASEITLDAGSTSQQTLEEMIRTARDQINPLAAQTTADATPQPDHQGYDINQYLNDPSNAAILNSTSSRPPIGYHVSLLHQICKTKGLAPEFEVEGLPGKAIFTGKLKVGDLIITLDDTCPSKKEARDRLVEKAIEPVNGIEIPNSVHSTSGGSGLTEEREEDKDQNWIGMLLGMLSPMFHPFPIHRQYPNSSLNPTNRIPHDHSRTPHVQLRLHHTPTRLPLLRLHAQPP